MIAILGAGITGLTAAYYIQKAGLPVVILEKSDTPGGNIRTLQKGPYLLETGPNTLQLNDALFEFLTETEFVDNIQYALPEAKYRYILKNNRYQRLPSSPLSLLFSRFFSWKAKRSITREPKVPFLEVPDETMDQFCRRRFGDEVTDYVVTPFVSGIYAGDPRQLLVDEAFPRLKEWEKTQGSVIKGFSLAAKANQHKGTFAFRGGIGELSRHLGDKVKIHYGTEVLSVKKQETGFLIETNTIPVEASHVISTVPAHTAATLFQELSPEFSAALGAIEYPPVSVVHTAYKKSNVGQHLKGFGALHPPSEQAFSLGTLFTSTIFEGRCPDDEVLYTTFVGGIRHPERAMQPDGKLKEGVRNDLGKFLEVQGDPAFQSVIRWPKAIPQYNKTITGYKPFLEGLSQQGLLFGGNWAGGVAVGSCVERGRELAASVVKKATFLTAE
ncbi:protoporphyrinogen oxidase [bacterium]|nr:protoporphyrinogen oxidase [bacterium]